MIRIHFLLLVFGSLILIPKYGEAQSLPVVPFGLDNDLRILQLQGEVPGDHSLTIRPFRFSRNFTPDSFYKKLDPTSASHLRELKKTFFNGRGKLSLLPFRNILKYVSHHPYGWSDGSLMTAKGFQQVSSVGVFGGFGPIAIQFAPEFLYAENGRYEIAPNFGNRKSGDPIKRMYPGQSRISVNAGALSMGISTENLWWGPGQFTSLMMTNNAPGFLHATFQTRRPLKTVIGSFEWQLIGGRLVANDSRSEDVYDGFSFKELTGFETASGDYSKYLNALNISYTPSFLSFMTLGINRSFVTGSGNVITKISKQVGLFSAFFPVFDGLFKSQRGVAFEDSLLWNQLASVNAKMQFKKIKSEVYFEYGWNDHKFNLRDMMQSVNHSAAFLVGAKKIFDLKRNRVLDVSVEYNQMSESPDYLVRGAGAWYVHGYASHLSSYGEILGSGVGLGSDLFTLSTTYRKGMDQFGLRFEKINRYPARYSSDWTDFSLTWSMRKKLSKFLINAQVSGVHSRNYGWMQSRNRFNAVTLVGVQYYW